MYSYSKEKGLSIVNQIQGYKLKVDVISDLHLDFYKSIFENNEEFLNRFIESKINIEGNKDLLIVAGDISHSNSLSLSFLKKLSNIWSYVLVIPGNHDWYLQKKEEDRYGQLVENANSIENIVFLMDKVEIFEYKGVKIAGTFMAYNLNSLKDYSLWKSILNDSKFLSREFINKRNEKDVNYYNRVINEVDIFVSHIPILNLDGLDTVANLFLNVDVNAVKDVLYISGHTHRQKNSVTHFSEGCHGLNVSYGYPNESKKLNSAVTTIFIQ